VKSVHESKEQLISALFIGGGACFVLGLFLTFGGMLLRAGILFALGPVLILVALCLVGGALYIGISHNKSMAVGPARPQEEARVIARFAINGIGEMIFDNYDYDAEEARFYVKVQYLNGRREEFECARPVFDQAGEGMRGMLTIQGGWLSMFTPLMDTEETKAAYRGY
jgi:hypothetical protein